MRRILAVLGVVFLVGCLFLPLVSALSLTFDCGTSLTGMAAYAAHPSLTADRSALGSAFNASASGYVQSVNTYGYALTGLTGFAICRIYNVSGVIDSNAVPDVLIGSSEYLTLESMPQGSANIDWFTFVFTEEVSLTAGSNYTVHVEVVNASSYASYVFHIRYGTTGQSASSFVYNNGGWNYLSNTPFAFDVYVDASPPSPTPTPTPTAEPSGDGDATLEYWGGIVADWIFPILLVLVPAVIAAYYLGKIGFIIGLNIGMILGYAALPAIFGLWTVIMLVLVDVAYFFFARDR